MRNRRTKVPASTPHISRRLRTTGLSVASNDKPKKQPDQPGDIGDAFNLVKAYAKQETLDPLRTVGSYLKFAVPGALLLAVGWLFLLIGLLRALQTELDLFDHKLSFVPYFIVTVVGGVIAFLFARRVLKGDLRG
jgi:hypothetical protein